MVVMRAFFISRYVHIAYKQLTLKENTIAIGQIRFALSDRFNLRTRQYQTRRERIQECIFEGCAPVFNFD
jgi:hypothetical protein